MISPSALITLIRDAQADDKNAMEVLLRLVRERMKGFFCRRVGPIESSDLAQDILIKVSLHLVNFEVADLDDEYESAKRAEHQFWGWVTRMARNRCVDENRRKNRAKRAVVEVPLPQGSSGGVRLPAADDTPSQAILRREQERQTRAALAALSVAEKNVIQLRYFEEKPWPEVAQTLGKTEAATKKFYQRTIKKWHQAACAKD